MSYHVIRTINGRRYRYLQRSVREGKRVRSEYVYLGPEEPPEYTLSEELKNMVRKTYELTDEEVRLEAERQQEFYAQRDRINELLTADTISLAGLQEVADAQKESPAADAEGSEGTAGAGEDGDQ